MMGRHPDHSVEQKLSHFTAGPHRLSSLTTDVCSGPLERRSLHCANSEVSSDEEHLLQSRTNVSSFRIRIGKDCYECRYCLTCSQAVL